MPDAKTKLVHETIAFDADSAGVWTDVLIADVSELMYCMVSVGSVTRLSTPTHRIFPVAMSAASSSCFCGIGQKLAMR